MGHYFLDHYSYLHFASGIIAYFWNINFKYWLILHTLFETIENTQFGMNFINKYISFWPGGKPTADSFINIIGDTVSAMIGWLSAYLIVKLTSKHSIYQK